MANPTIGIDVVARLDQLNAQLKTLSPSMAAEAKAMTAALAKEVRAQTAAMRTLGASGKQAASGLGAAAGQATNLRAQLFDVVQQVSAGQNPLMILNQQGFQIAEAFGRGGGAGAMSLLGAAIAPLVPLIAVVGTTLGTAVVAWKVYNEESGRAAETAKMVADAHEALESIFDSTARATLELAAATGALSDEELRVEQNALRVQEEVSKATAGAVANMKMLHEEMGGLGATIGDFAEKWMPSWTPLAMVVDGLTDSSAELRGQMDALSATTTEAAEAGTKNRVVTEALVRAKGDLAKASRAAADGEKLLAKRYDEEVGRIHGVQDALAEMVAASDAAVDSRLEGARAIRAALLDEVAGLEATRDAGLAQARSDEERAALYDEFMTAKVNMTAAAEEEIAAIVEASAEKRDKVLATQAADYQAWLDDRAAATSAAWADVTQSTGAMIGDLSGYLADQAEDMAGTNKKAARAMFLASQIAAGSQAIINTALGITQALTLPPPADAIKAALVATTGAVQIAAIAGEQPSFHAGGMMPDERSARVLTGESVLNRQATAALGAGGVAAINQGGASAGVGAVSFRVGRLEAREIARTDLAAGGAIPAAIRRAVAKGSSKAGRSGRPPIA